MSLRVLWSGSQRLSKSPQQLDGGGVRRDGNTECHTTKGLQCGQGGAMAGQTEQKPNDAIPEMPVPVKGRRREAWHATGRRGPPRAKGYTSGAASSICPPSSRGGAGPRHTANTVHAASAAHCAVTLRVNAFLGSVDTG